MPGGNAAAAHGVHLEACEYIPSELITQHRELASQPYRKIHLKYIKLYFAEAACELGMVETPNNGLFFGAPPNTSGKPSDKLLAIMCIAENPTASEYKQLRDLIFPKVDERLQNSKFSHVASPGRFDLIIQFTYTSFQKVREGGRLEHKFCRTYLILIPTFLSQ
jgi:hypothetical protein